MGYQVDYLQVGNGETSGDCIALRFGDLHSGDPNKQHVIVIDGGFTESGEKLVAHIQKHFNTSYVDLIISTHLDRDHIAGLKVVLEKLTVERLLMHQPWRHSVNPDGDFQKEAREARKSYDQASTIEAVAISNGVDVIEPFAGAALQFTETASMVILGPALDYYEHLLKDYDHNKSALSKLLSTLTSPAVTAVEVFRKIQETLDPSTETLDHVDKKTSPENNSSVVAYFQIEDHAMLFTGDAGVDALHKAADFANANGINLTGLNFLGVPHHGSKHNLDTAFLDRVTAGTAFISVTKDSKKHPSPRVVNALVRRGVKVFTTEASNILHHKDSPSRAGYSSITPYNFVSEFADDE